MILLHFIDSDYWQEYHLFDDFDSLKDYLSETYTDIHFYLGESIVTMEQEGLPLRAKIIYPEVH